MGVTLKRLRQEVGANLDAIHPVRAIVIDDNTFSFAGSRDGEVQGRNTLPERHAGLRCGHSWG